MNKNPESIARFINNKPSSLKELNERFNHPDLLHILKELESSGAIWRNKSGVYSSFAADGLVAGTVRVHQKGYAFVSPFNEGDDYYIAPTHLKDALNGDVVAIKPNQKKNQQTREAKVIVVLKRSDAKQVGTVMLHQNKWVVQPTNASFFVQFDEESAKQVVEGHKVVFSITTYDPKTKQATGILQEILGHQNDPGVDILSIVKTYDITTEFHKETLQQAEHIPSIIPPEEIDKRRDLRETTIITIDGADAKDLDDAISLTYHANGNYTLGVHIADVSHYVNEKSPLDKEAFERGTSIYLVDRVIPMLPHRLSNGICSLIPHEDRLTLSCEMTFDQSGTLIDYDIFESVIRSKARMTYDAVNHALVHDDKETIERYNHVLPLLRHMRELSTILRYKRTAKGAISFETKEAKMNLDGEGKPLAISYRKRDVAEKMIEDFMLAANETIATHFKFHNLPFIYRVHDRPKSESVHALSRFLTLFGFQTPKIPKKIQSETIQHITSLVEGKEMEYVANRLILRSMAQAVYSPDNIGHFGLAMDNYTHFTSPIRRYPDLIVHRLIKTNLLQRSAPKKDVEELLVITEHCSERERRAADAERATIEYKKAVYMETKIGETFHGRVVSVTKHGLYVELENTIEGLVSLTSLKDDHYTFDGEIYALIGKKSGTRYQLGDTVKVLVEKVTPEEQHIDFTLLGHKKKNKGLQ